MKIKDNYIQKKEKELRDEPRVRVISGVKAINN